MEHEVAKLAELIDKARKAVRKANASSRIESNFIIAEFLIANGATISEKKQ